MKRLFPIVGCTLALCFSAFSVAVCAEQVGPSGYPTTDPFEALQRALRAERETRARTPGSSGGREVYETGSFLEGIRQALSRGDEQSALNAINQLEAMASTPELRRACEAMAEKVHQDRAARDEAFSTEVNVAIKHASDALSKATEPKELDALIEDFNRLAETRAGQYSDGRDNRLQQKIQGAITFLSRWQEYLIAQKKGDERAVANALRNLTESGYNHTMLVPRSEILARLPNTDESSNNGRNRLSRTEINAAVADILNGTNTLDDIPAALGKLTELSTRNGNNSSSDGSTDLGPAATNLQAIQKARAELQAGMATTINFNTLRGSSDPRSPLENKLTQLRAELIKLGLPRLLNATSEKPAEGEGVSNFLHRLVDLAKKRGDWAAVTRGLDMDRNLASSMNNYTASNTQEVEAYRQFFAGLNLEAAGQYVQAVISYLTALKSGAQDVPAAVIGEHLAAIEKAHPKEFAEANAHVLNPPAPAYQNSPYGPRGAYDPRLNDPRFNRPGYQPNPAEQGAPSTTVTIPAVTPSPAPSVSSSPTPAATPTTKPSA